MPHGFRRSGVVKHISHPRFAGRARAASLGCNGRTQANTAIGESGGCRNPAKPCSGTVVTDQDYVGVFVDSDIVDHALSIKVSRMF